MSNNVKAEKKSTQMAIALGDRHVLIDTCSVLKHSFSVFAGRYMVNSAFCKTELVLLEGLWEELTAKQNGKKLGKSAKQGLLILRHMCNHKFCRIVKGFNGKGFFDGQVKPFLSYYANDYKIAIITEDSGLAYDSLMMNNSKSAEYEQVTAYRLGDDGKLYAWKLD